MISCIISTYKRDPEILRRAIQSIQAQTFQDVEIIVVNDAPEETALAERIETMIRTFRDERICYVAHEHNMGACAARNTGAGVARGEFLAFLDDDDEWLPEKLEEQMKCMADEEVGAVSCESYTVNKVGEKIYSKRKWPEGTDLEVLLTGNWFGGVSFPLIRTSKFFEAGQFDVLMKSSQDTDMWIRLAKISRLAICYKPLLNYYITSDSISANIPAKIQGYERLLEKYREDYLLYPAVYRVRLLWIGRRMVYFGEYTKALRYFCLAVRSGAGIEDAARYFVRGYRSRKKALIESRMW